MNYSDKTFAPKPIRRFISTYSVLDGNKTSSWIKLQSKNQLWNSSLITINSSSTFRDSYGDFSNFETEMETDFAYLEISSILKNRSNLSSTIVLGNTEDDEDIANHKSSKNIVRPNNPLLKNLELAEELYK